MLHSNETQNCFCLGSQSYFKETFGFICLYGAKKIYCDWPLVEWTFKADIPPFSPPVSINMVFAFKLATQD